MIRMSDPRARCCGPALATLPRPFSVHGRSVRYRERCQCARNVDKRHASRLARGLVRGGRIEDCGFAVAPCLQSSSVAEGRGLPAEPFVLR